MNDHSSALTLVTLGLIFLAGLAADVLGRRTAIPRVSLLLLLGVGVGPMGLDVLPVSRAAWFPFVTDFALAMVAFLLGGELTLRSFRELGRAVLVVSVLVVVATALTVAGGLALLGWPLPVALLLGAVATSTDPAAVTDVVRESGCDNRFTRTMLGVVAVDDAWGIMAMSVALALVLGVESADAGLAAAWHGFVELGGAVVVGCALGVPLALLTGRVRAGEPTQAEALGGVLLCAGVALFLNVSLLLAAMTMGAVVANLARHHRRPFHAIEGIEWPFMVLFFVLSGASLELAALGSVALLAPAYILLRVLGRVLGGVLGGRALRESGDQSRRLGVGLLPQAGIAIGMALVASQQVPEFGKTILATTIAATIVFEVVGPMLTRAVVLASAEPGSG